MLLHSAPLGDAIRAIRLKESVQLEGDHAYIAMCMKLPLPLLPEYTPRRSFVSYIESMDFDKNGHGMGPANGPDIMPVLPAHLRSHVAMWQRSEWVHDAMDKAESGVAALANLSLQTSAMYVEDSTKKIQRTLNTQKRNDTRKRKFAADWLCSSVCVPRQISQRFRMLCL